MLLNGPPSVTAPAHTDDANLSLRVNQRIVAEVLSISGETVTLSLQGVHIVAKLTSQDQAAALQEHRLAQFVIRDLAANNVLLQLVSPVKIIPNSDREGMVDLAANLLQIAGLPPTEENIQILRAMLSQGMTIDKQTLEELKYVLQQLGSWNEADAKLAASLKNAGLPVSAEIIKFIKESPSGFGNQISQLLEQLQYLARQTQSPPLSQSAQLVLEYFRSMILEWSSSPTNMAEKLRTAVMASGRSLENQLAELVEKGISPGNKGSGLGVTAIATLRHELIKAGFLDILEELDQFQNSMRYTHLINGESGTSGQSGQWASLEIPLHLAFPSNQGLADQPAQLYEGLIKIAYQKDGESRSINPEFTQVIIQINLSKHESIEVALSIAGRQVGAEVLSSSSQLNILATEEISSLADGLSQLGFKLQTSRCQVGDPVQNLAIPSRQIDPTLFKNINIIT
jgi:hypothetical protein